MLRGRWGDRSHAFVLSLSLLCCKLLGCLNNILVLTLTCSSTGSMNLEVKEEDVLETLELLSERLGHEDPSKAWQSYSARQQQALKEKQDGVQDHPMPDQGPSSQATPQDPAPPATNGTLAPVAKGCAAGKPGGPLAAVPWFARVGGQWLPPDHPLSHIETRLRHGGACDVCRWVSLRGMDSWVCTNKALCHQLSLLFFFQCWLFPCISSVNHFDECGLLRSAVTSQPLVTPCGHMLCLDCTKSSPTCCPLPSCVKPYVMQVSLSEASCVTTCCVESD